MSATRSNESPVAAGQFSYKAGFKNRIISPAYFLSNRNSSGHGSGGAQ
jgi:hypothetical protein